MSNVFSISKTTAAMDIFLFRFRAMWSGAHPASYPMGTRVSFPGDKAAGA
jgi:hypothetical protein